MKQLIFLIFFFVTPVLLFGQQPMRGSGELGTAREDTLETPLISTYKIIDIKGDTTFVDTSLTIEKYYRFNYLRKDNFELLPFANVGRPYNRLGYEIKGEELMPQFVAGARQIAFFDAEDIRYYEVPTPTTELFYKTVPEQGQILDALFTVNTSPRLNFSLAYKGVRALGKYQNELTSTGQFRTTLNYRTLNNRYSLKAHFVSQNLLNMENGGLDELSLQQYINKAPEFEDRSILEVKFENAENVLSGKRFYLNHQYDLMNGSENRIALNHILNFSDQKYVFDQSNPVDYFGDSFRNSNLHDEVELRTIDNTVAISYDNSLLGSLRGKGKISTYNYGYNSVLILDDQSRINNRLQGEIYSVGGEYANSFGSLEIYGDAMVNLVSDFSGHYLTAGVGYPVNENNYISAEINTNERAPDFNFLLYQSDYENYNWQNNFDNQSKRRLKVELASKSLLDAEASIAQIDNYTYFSRDVQDLVKPFQYNGTVNYLKVKVSRELKYGKFALDNTLMYQKVTEGDNVFNVPNFVTRNSLYFSDHLFKRALFLQTGLTLKYFTPYQMNGYDPVLAEFFVQNEQELGGFPAVDFFFNGRIQRTRIYFILEHVNSLITGNNNFSAPDYPYRDFIVRFGLVWNFFM